MYKPTQGFIQHHFSAKSGAKRLYPAPSSERSGAGFTLIELLIVIGIIGILAAVVTLVIDPIELLRRARDGTRVVDMQSVNSALKLYETDGKTAFGDPNTIYISIPDTLTDCGSLSLPPPPSSWSYACVTESVLQRVDGTGWIPINLVSISGDSPISKLPIDPVNSDTDSLYYSYVTGASWMLTALLQSERELKATAAKDGGTDPGRFEIGTDPFLWAKATGLVGYWKFDEGGGTTANDSSGQGNTGTTHGPAWTTALGCKQGGCLSFDGVNDYVSAANSPSLNPGADLTMEAWIYWNGGGGDDNVVTKESAYEFRVQGGYINYATNPWAWRGGTSAQISIGSWHHIVITHDGDGLQKIYIDGVEKYSATSGGSIATNSRIVTIGARSDGAGSFFNGLIDDVRIYNRALSANEIKAIYNATK